MIRGLNDFCSQRLLQALAVRRLTQVQLAAMVGVSPSTVSKWRNEQQAPEPETLRRLASVINVSPEWFTRPISSQISAPLFRSNASAHVAARAMLHARLEWTQDIVSVLAEYVDFPSVSIPLRSFTEPEQITTEEIEIAAIECRDVWGLGRGPVPDVALALESAGVIVVREETGVPQIEGLSSWSIPLNRPLVLLAADKDNGFRSRFDAAHELGHLVLHRHITKVADRIKHNEMEKQAHRFSGAFLLPAESFASEIRFPVTLDSLLLLKQRWGVSVAAIIMRLEALGLIDDEAKLSLFKRRSARWGAKAEPGDDGRLPEKPRLLKRTVELLASSGVMPLERFAPHIGLAERDIEALMGLREGYLSQHGEVVEFVGLRQKKARSFDPGANAQSDGSNVLPFRK